MTFSTSMGVALTRIAMLTGTRTSVVSFTSILETIRLTSEHLGVPNEQIHVESLSFEYLPSGAGTITATWEVDNRGTNSVTFNQNPFTYGLIGDTTTNTSFILADSQSDSTATDMPRPDDVYTNYLMLGVQGKTFEFKITASGETDFRPVGVDVEVKVAGRAPAYVGGKY